MEERPVLEMEVGMEEEGEMREVEEVVVVDLDVRRRLEELTRRREEVVGELGVLERQVGRW